MTAKVQVAPGPTFLRVRSGCRNGVLARPFRQHASKGAAVPLGDAAHYLDKDEAASTGAMGF